MALVNVATCESCGRHFGERHKATTPRPTAEELMEMEMEDYQATDGCTVEPDGVCPHGHSSWALQLGMV
jgi:hypothetical protein